MFATLDAKLKLPEPPPKPDSPPAEPKPAPGQTPAAPKPGTAPQPPKQVVKEPKQLREELNRVSGEVTTLRTELEQSRAKIADYEKRGKDTEALQALHSKIEQELNDTRAQLRLLKFEASDEYKKNYEKPFEERAEFAKVQIEQLTVTEGEGSTPRPATWNDFRALYQMPINKATMVAKELFGDAAGIVISHLSDLQKMDYTRQQALVRERENHAQRTKEEEGKRVQQQQEIHKQWQTINTELSQKVEDYRNDPTDKELNDIRQEGYRVFDAEPENMAQRIVKDAHIRQRVAAYGVQKLQIARLQKQIADLQAELESHKETPPGDTRRPGGSAPEPQSEDWAAGLKKSVPTD